MSTPVADDLHRTLKVELDEGRARSLDEAHEIVARYVLQIDVGREVSDSPTRQAMLLTAVNAGRRAFLGGVRVRIRADAPMSVRWAGGKDLAASVEAFGGKCVESLDDDYPTLVIGDVKDHSPGAIVLYATWQGWAGGIVLAPEHRLLETPEFPLAGMLAAAIGVSEAFLHVRGDPVPGRRHVGLSLWRPGTDWLTVAAHGEPCLYLPSKVWLVGLGHLGQAYAWALGLLPYPDPAVVELMLQDYDSVVTANESTGMLSAASAVGRKKSRVVAELLETLGFATLITERRFDSRTRRHEAEPGLALVGVDDPAPRRLLEDAGFDLVVDAGLGGGPQNFLDMTLHSFPSSIDAKDSWPEHPASSASPLIPPAGIRGNPTAGEGRRRANRGRNRMWHRRDSGRSVGAAFVGCVAATLVVSEVLRSLVDGPRYEVVSLSLRSPNLANAAVNSSPGSPVNPGFVALTPG